MLLWDLSFNGTNPTSYQRAILKVKNHNKFILFISQYRPVLNQALFMKGNENILRFTDHITSGVFVTGNYYKLLYVSIKL